jgi:hypothetical protein
MKTMKMVPWLLAFTLIFGFSSAALSGGGGPEDPAACDVVLSLDSNDCPADAKRVYAEITVARETPPIIGPGAYSVQISSRDKKRGKPKEVHLFSFQDPLGVGDLCAASEEDFLELFYKKPCALDVHIAFDFVGLPVFEEFEIIAFENCCDPETPSVDCPAEMILIRAVVCDTEFVPVVEP